MYALAKNLLFCLNPEAAHEVSMELLGAAERLRLLKTFAPRVPATPVEVMGLQFANPVGLAAGLDKNGDYFNAMGQLGFGFVEIGTVTPEPQPGNPLPRLFRLKAEEAIINRMGFNNKGVAHLVANIARRRYRGVLGVNIGKNKTTPEAQALSDYQRCMDAVYPHADYIAINVSSPNTPGLRDFQFGELFDRLLAGIKQKQAELQAVHGRYVPVAVKIAPDMSDDEIKAVADALMQHKLDAVIATNTTIGREGVENTTHAHEAGGLSGAPLREKSTHVIAVLADHLAGAMPIIGVGGIMTGDDAREKIEAGARLVQIYSGFIFRGPGLIKEAAEAVASAL